MFAHDHVNVYVRVQTPAELDPTTGEMVPGRVIGFDSGMRDGPGRDLLTVTTTKDMSQPAGSITLAFKPRVVQQGKTWADLIPGYSLIEVWMQRRSINPEPVLVMVGITGARNENEAWRDHQPQRAVTVTARELSAVFVDQKSFYIPEINSELFDHNNPDGPQPNDLYSLRTKLLGRFSIDPILARGGDNPARTLGRFLDFILQGDDPANPSPLVGLTIDNVELRDLFYYQEALAAADLLDERSVLPSNFQSFESGTPFWNLMQSYVEMEFHEFWAQSRVREEFPRDSHPFRAGRDTAVEIIFRKRPFGGRIRNGRIEGLRGYDESQFDVDFEQDRTQNFEWNDTQVISDNVTRHTADVKTLWYFYPTAFNYNNSDLFRFINKAVIELDERSPSYFKRWGLRPHEGGIKYLANLQRQAIPGIDVQEDPGQSLLEQGLEALGLSEALGFTAVDPLEAARTVEGADLQPPLPAGHDQVTMGQQWSRIMRNWEYLNPLFRSGSIELRGDPRRQVGKRAVWRSRNFTREFYVTGVTHTATMGTDSPTLIDTLKVERGHDLR